LSLEDRIGQQYGVSYGFDTFLKEADYPLDGRYDRCFEDAENVVFELNFDSTQTPAFQQYTVMKAFYPQGETFRSSVSDSTYTLVKNKLLELGLPIEKLNAFQPWFIAITMLSLNLQELGFDPKLGVDQHFFEQAKEEQKILSDWKHLNFNSTCFQLWAGKIRKILSFKL